MLSKLRVAIPLLLFLIIVLALWRGLSLHPNEVPSPLVSKPAPEFQAPTLHDPQKFLTNRDFFGHVTLLNVWATWCAACAYEHSLLIQIAQNDHLTIFGLDYKDDPTKARNWLKEHGNPYQFVAVDTTGDIGIEWGVYGTPETFVIDKKGTVRYKHIGAMTPDVYEKTIRPLVIKLEAEPA